MKKLSALLNAPARAVIAVGMIMLVSELLIMVVIEGANAPFVTHELWRFIDPILLIAIVSPALYLLSFRPLRNQQAEIERQLDELGRFHNLSIGRELRMKELVEEIAALHDPLSAEPAGDIPVTGGSPEAPRDAAAQPTTRPTEQSQLSGLLFMLEDLENTRRKIEQAHQEWIAALDVVEDPIFLHDKQFRILRCNKAYQQCAGIPFKQIIGQPYYAIFPKNHEPLPSCRRAMEKAEEEKEEEEVVVAVGDAIYRSRTLSVHDEQGAYLYSVHTLEDITEKQRAEAERERLSEAIHQAAEAIAMANADACFTYINPAFTRLFGYAPDEIIGQSTAILSVPAAGTVQPAAAFRIVREQGFFQGEALRRAKDGMNLPVYINVAALHGSGGRFEGFVTAITDLRPIKKSQQALVESEERFRKITESAQDAIIMMADKRISFWNAAAERIFGYTAGEALGQELHALLIPRQAYAAFAHGYTHFQESGDGPVIGKVIEVTALRKGGEEFSVELSISATQFGGQWHAIGIVRDITQRKQAEESLHESEEKFRVIFDGALDGLLLADAETKQFASGNPAIFQMLGYSPEEAMQLSFADIHPQQDLPYVIDQFERQLRGEIQLAADIPIKRKDGSVFYADIQSSLVRLGGNAYFLGIFRDITERKQAETAIQHANRALATLGAVNRNLVHAVREDELLQAVCNAIVEQRGYRLAWVGYKQHDEHESIKIMARAGQDEGYLDALQLSWAENEHGMGPSGRAIRSGAAQLCQDMANDPLYRPWCDEALKRGFAARIALPLTDENVNDIFGILNVYAAEVNAFTPAEVELLEEMAGDLAFGVRSLHIRHERDLALEQNQRQLTQLQDSLEDTVRAIATIVEMRDPYTAGHQSRVADLAAAIARQMGLPDAQVHGIHLAGVVHDLGKIKIPAEILSKPGKITDIEFSLIKIHPQAGYDILKGINFPWPIAQMVLQHHERLDGSGYPQGLKGEAILLEARILSVADVVEAISAHRPYRPGLGIEAALEEIAKQRGVRYDSRVVDACLTLFRELHYSFKS